MNKLKASAIALAVSMGLAACGGSGSSGGGSSAAVESPTFQSSFINGVNYSTPTRSGVTGENCTDIKPGCFDIVPGESVTFTIGNLVLPSVTYAAGQERITVVDIAKAIDPEATILGTPAAAIVAYLDALNDPDAEVTEVDGRKVFNVRSVSTPEATVDLTTLVQEVEGGKDLKEALEEALAEAGEEDVVVNPDANRDTDLAKDDFDNGLEPSADVFEKEGLSLIVADLLGLWTLTEDAGIGGIFFGSDGKSDFITTFAANQENGPELNLGDNWNVKDNQLVVTDSENGRSECILTARESNTLTLSCFDFDSDGLPEDDEAFEVTLTKVNNLAGILAAGDGIWNVVYEERFNETGTATFGPNNQFSDTISDRDEDGETGSASGTFAVDGSKVVITVTMEDGVALNPAETFTCFFAGLKRNAQSQVEDIFFRCEGDEEEGPEDLLLTKRAGVADLENTSVHSATFES